MKKILDLDLKVFELQIWLYFNGFGRETFWTAIYNYIY